MKTIKVPKEGYFPSLDHMFMWKTDSKGNLRKSDKTWLMPASKTKKGTKNVLNSIRWHTCNMTEEKVKFLEQCVMTVKFGNWTKEQIMQAQTIAKEHGLHVVMAPKDWVNGARGSSGGIGKLFLSPHKLVENMMSEYDIPDKKKLAYTSLVLGECVKFKTAGDRIRVHIAIASGDGRAYMSSELNELNELGGVCKLGGVTKDIAIINDRLCKEHDCDLFIYEDGNKLKLSKEMIEKRIGHKPSCHPLVKFAKNDPTFRWGLLAAQPDEILPDLLDERIIVETGKMGLEDVYCKLGYPSDDGTKIKKALRPLTIGMNVFTSNIAVKSLSTAIKKKIFKHVYGITGTLCDIRELPHIEPVEGVGMRPPNQRLVKCVVKIDYDRGLIGVQPDIIKDVGGDMDGDLFMFIEKCNAHDMWFIDPDKYPMLYPDKKDAEDNESSMFSLWCDTVDAVSKVGKVHNDSVVKLTTAIFHGITEEQKIELINDITYYDETYIHSFKHGCNEHVPGLKDRLEGSEYKGLLKACAREQVFSSIMRRGTVLDWIAAANKYNAKYDAPFFEKLCSLFKEWKPNLQQDNEHLLEELDPIRKLTYRNAIKIFFKTGNFDELELAIRWKKIKLMLKGKYDTLFCAKICEMFILQCYRKNDWQIANYAWESWYSWKTKEEKDEN